VGPVASNAGMAINLALDEALGTLPDFRITGEDILKGVFNFIKERKFGTKTTDSINRDFYFIEIRIS
jgi:hypothetical protein